MSVCSGIEAATCAWHPLGWEPAAFSEIEPFPSEVLNHHYPDVPNLGDMTKFEEWNLGTIDLLVGGTPCQSFSVAGLRKGLDDPRGNLMLTYLAIARKHRPRWLVWENVPGVLSSNGGEDFASLLRGLVELGYGWAYRVLDAQYVRTHEFPRAVPQRRRRIFVVGYLGSWHRAAAVLFERHCLSGNPEPSRTKIQDIASGIERSSHGDGVPETVGTLCADTHPGSYSGQDAYTGRLIPHPITEPMVVHGTQDPIISNVAFPLATNQGQENAVVYEYHPADSRVREMGEVCQTMTQRWGTGGGNVPIMSAYRKSRRAQSTEDSETWVDDGVANTLNLFDQGDVRSTQAVVQTIPIHDQATRFSGKRGDKQDGKGNGFGVGQDGDPAPTLTKGDKHAVMNRLGVRRLTPLECERLQGFRDGYTAIPWKGKETPDGLRYKALGNSMAVNVMAWIGERIQAVDELPKQETT